MVQVTYPGVYIQEIPSGVHTITSVATSITAFVDFFKEGPMDEAVEIFGMTDFQRVFGGLDDRSEASYAIAQFFLNGGATALVVRCASELRSAPPAATDKPLETASVGIAATAAGGAAVLTVSAASPGVWGNTLRAEIDHRTADPTKFFNLTITRYDSDKKTAAPVAHEQYTNLALDSNSSRSAPEIVNVQSKLIRISVPSGTTGVPAADGTESGDLSALTQAQFDGFAGKKLRVNINTSPTYEATFASWGLNAVSNLFQLASQLETALRTAVDTSATPAPTPPALTGASVYVLGGKTLVVLAGRGDPSRDLTDKVTISLAGADTTATDLKLTTGTNAGENTQQYPLGSSLASAEGYIQGKVGADGLPPDADAICGAVAQANQHGMFALDKVDLFNILCIPRAAEIGNNSTGEAQMQTIVSQVLAYCDRRRAFFVLDTPEKVNDIAKMKDWLDTHASFRNNNAAVYFPRLQIPDPLNEYRLRSVGASGTMAGVYSRTDSERGVWKAPAGIETVLNGVSALDYKMNDAENGILNPLGINCMRIFPIYGTISWGARTLEGADAIGSEWKYIPIRRLALMLEESLFRGTKWVVFEPNDEPLWAKIRLNVGAYMMSLFRQGAFQGTSPKEAFFIKCDAETTTQNDRNLGIVNILVGFAPLKPAEFVVISIQQIAGQL
jgi:Bacteriophage tail sheath protein